jgi:hypothetical protein
MFASLPVHHRVLFVPKWLRNLIQRDETVPSMGLPTFPLIGKKLLNVP